MTSPVAGLSTAMSLAAAAVALGRGGALVDGRHLLSLCSLTRCQKSAGT